MKRFLAAMVLLAMPLASAAPDATKAANARVSLVYEHELPNVSSKSIKAVLVEYGPGGHSAGHTHPASAFIYAIVLEGAIASQINEEAVKTYRTGPSFSELPGDRHRVSANASKTKPAKLLAVFVVQDNSRVLVEFPNMTDAENWYNFSDYVSISQTYVANSIDLALVDGIGPDFTMAGFARTSLSSPLFVKCN